MTADVPPPPSATTSSQPAPTDIPPAVTAPSTPPPEIARPEPEIIVPRHARVLYSETGWASWYGPGFQHRRTANGDKYDMNRLTAAHRTLPLNSIARVTNVKTGQSVLLRITDRGPFVSNRILDLSRAAAQKLDVYQRGTALVRIDVLQSPAPITNGGRWCVQIGAFENKEDASRLKKRLTRRYHSAKVLQFSSPVGGDWLRVLVTDDDKRRAEEVMHETHTDAGMYLVRLD